MGVIISISGRKGSGKSVLAELLLQQGFEKVSFADTLKELVCSIYDWDIQQIGKLEYKEEALMDPVSWGPKEATLLEKMIKAPIGSIPAKDYIFFTRREALQYIGTEILRGYDTQFHVKALIKRLKKDRNYVLDDTRFPNELAALKNRGAICLFVIRPNNFDFSNHPSEVSLSRHDFEHIILNDKSLEAFKKSGSWFFNTILSPYPPKISRQQLKEMLLMGASTKEAADQLNCSRDKLVWWARKHLIRLEDRRYNYNDDAFSNPTIEAGYWAGYLSADGCLKKSGRSQTSYVVDLCSIDFEVVQGFKNFLKSDKPIYSKPPGCGYPSTNMSYNFIINSSYIIDDLKLWNLRPRKGVNNELPTIALQNEECLKAWYVGLIDGDGSIYRPRLGNRLMIKLLGSLPVLQYLSTWSGIKHSKIAQEKEVRGLYTMAFCGKNATKLAYWLNPNLDFGLRRKWSKVEC